MKYILKHKFMFLYMVVFMLLLTGCRFSLNIGFKNEPMEESVVKEESSYDEELIKAAEMAMDEAVSKLINLQNKDEVEAVLSEIKNNEALSLQTVYIASAEGDFYASPKMALPEDYDPRPRVWYTKAMDEDLYVSEIYEDAQTGNMLISVSKAIIKDDQVLGVIGIDLILGK